MLTPYLNLSSGLYKNLTATILSLSYRNGWRDDTSIWCFRQSLIIDENRACASLNNNKLHIQRQCKKSCSRNSRPPSPIRLRWLRWFFLISCAASGFLIVFKRFTSIKNSKAHPHSPFSVFPDYGSWKPNNAQDDAKRDLKNVLKMKFLNRSCMVCIQTHFHLLYASRAALALWTLGVLSGSSVNWDAAA